MTRYTPVSPVHMGKPDLSKFRIMIDCVRVLPCACVLSFFYYFIVGRLVHPPFRGNGIILEKGSKTIHGYDAVTSATNLNRYTTPWGWERPYIKLYLILDQGIYEYLPQSHELKFIKSNPDSDDTRDAGMIVIAADFNQISSSHLDVRNVTFVSAGSAAQNIYLAASVHNIQTFTKVFISKKWLIKTLELSDKVEPLVTLAFGYAE